MTNKKKLQKPISLPALRGRMGSWYYYVTLISFKEVAERVSLPEEIDEYEIEEFQLGEWIQRELEEKRIKVIVNYLKKQKQRFFNSLILGIYGGQPTWQDLNITINKPYNSITPETLQYMGRTLGILTLHGDESIFAIDGQHRAIGIREAVKTTPKLENEEISAIFVAHKTNEEGKIRTRRLLSTLNQYAKPVNKREIIILSEDNNCAIVTRYLIENFESFKNKILIHKTRVIRPENQTAFTNIIVLYDIVECLLTDKKVAGITVNGRNFKSFTTEREDEQNINIAKQYVKRILQEVFHKIPSYNKFFRTGNVDRTEKGTSLLFRPIGQNILFDVLKVANSKNKKQAALVFFAKDDFNLRNRVWKKIFWDEETETIITDKSRQRYATLLILEHIGIQIKRTKKDIEVFNNFGMAANQI